MDEVIVRSKADVDRTVLNMLNDFKAHRVSEEIAAEIQEAAWRESGERDILPWAGVVLMALVIFTLFGLWAIGVI